MIRNIRYDVRGDPDLPDMVYYNLDIINGKATDEGEGANPLARFSETRDTAIIKDTSQYYFSIVRFSLDGSDKTLPIFIPRIVTGATQNNINLTEYTIGFELTLTNGGNTQTFRTTQPIIWIPQDLAATAPRPPVAVQSFESNYYYCYSLDHWLNLVNNACIAAFTDLQAQVTASPLAPYAIQSAAPFFKYDRSTKLFSIYCDTFGFGGIARRSAGQDPSEDFHIYFNSNLYGLFSFFPHNYLGGDLAARNIPAENEWAYEILVRDEFGSNIYRPTDPAVTAITNTPSYWVVNQESISTSTLWSPIGSIVFVSSLIPVLNEQTGEPIKFGEGNVISSTGSQSAFQPIITDITIPVDNAYSYSQFTLYVPTAEYRLSNLSNSPQEIRNIDVQVYWKNRLDGNLVPIELFNLSNISIKMLFRRKDYAMRHGEY
jgi:hypothetical protein